MSSQTIQAMPFTQIIAFKSYLDNLEKPLNSTLNGAKEDKINSQYNADISYHAGQHHSILQHGTNIELT